MWSLVLVEEFSGLCEEQKKTCHIRRVKSGGGKKCSFPTTNKSRASSLQGYTVM